MTQFSLFGAAAATPTLDDLDGLLLAGGGWVRSGPGARVSVVVADRWRADALCAAFAELDVVGSDAVVTASSGFGARTAFSPALLPHAQRWTRGAGQGLPRSFRLGPGGLRLWAVAAGRRDEAGYLLATAAGDDPTHHAIHLAAGAQLSQLGVAAVSLGARGGPGWRVTSSRRLRRLVELLGPAPDGAGTAWPAPPT
ncbi:hypothetical protein SAMN05443575_1358 [Jatrophihabitans endophyticus]|uniref:Uncharacterized protein n=1 Tax=Jatrophihabitans endophyticus TaxID=1206085 RepID=A0A1M5H105_9ACTN|nr:hypothetical protein [Jatrophihabitans endophyticus]SHG09605.1 hypothetical protein SAMN05443575_1358 [Jatrophihabitans endophyticus]